MRQNYTGYLSCDSVSNVEGIPDGDSTDILPLPGAYAYGFARKGLMIPHIFQKGRVNQRFPLDGGSRPSRARVREGGDLRMKVLFL